jgi:CMP-N,N'-diacetyllegionaminic acid synthase
MEILVVIPARGGSKGIPGKNIKLLNGKPLIAYTIASAREIFQDKQICVSTDSVDILRTVEDLGLKVPFLRPAHLSTDKAGSIEVLIHAIEYYRKKKINVDVVVLLQPTSPFRSSLQIREALELMDESCDVIVSVKETKANPYSVLFEENAEGFLEKSMSGNFTRRQDCPEVWELNGAIYCINVNSIVRSRSFNQLKLKKYVMDEKSSIDLDTPLDWSFAQFLLGEVE